MLYPHNIEEKIGFTRIKSLIRDKCEGEPGKLFVDRIRFTTDYEEIIRFTSQTDEFLKIIRARDTFPAGSYFDIQNHLTRASKIDACLDEENFHEMKLSLIKVEEILKFFKKKDNEYPNLALTTVGIYLNPQITYEIEKVIDERGKIRNTASPELQQIRNELQKLEFKVRNKLENILKNFISDGYSNDDAAITIRNGRLVVPVRSEFKRTVNGFIHDESATGLTAFIEPAQVVEINNDIRDLIHQEKREIIRILTGLTDLIRPEINNLKQCNEFLALIDFIRAKARLSVDLDAVLPDIQKNSMINWHDARHPLLYLTHKKVGKPVVPLNISLDQDNRILVISGPNAGGKSVCLQTVGLLQYMLQCGMLVPLSEGSRVGIFHQIFIDIGDEQSLENDLSTYSSHLINMKYFLGNANKKTLILIDEFGSGTEPQFGGAIAEAILEEVSLKRSYGVVTTHYTNLKKFAEDHKGISNGAMRFDINKMEPLFILDSGKPGSSFALEIARKIGLPENILEKAKGNVGAGHVKFERLISELEQEKREFEQHRKFIAAKETELKKLVREYEDLKHYLNNKQEEIILNAKKKAEDLVRHANREIENTIRVIKEEKADKEKTKKARANLNKFRESINPGTDKTNRPRIEKKSSGIPEGPIQKNDYVKIRDTGAYGMVIGLKGKQAEVAIGDLKSKIHLARLEKISASEFKSHTKGLNSGHDYRDTLDLGEKRKDFSNTLDLRGKRADEAIRILGIYLDDALLLDEKEIRILHGKGDGILRNTLRNYLLQVDFVRLTRDEDVEKGGAGITVINLK